MRIQLLLVLVLSACSIKPVSFTAEGGAPDAAIGDVQIVEKPTCDDGKRNGDETDQDCGGSCGPCANALICALASDCTSGVCTDQRCAAPTCTDATRNGNETDRDCGGSCPPCLAGERCEAARDCTSGVCTDEACRAATCSDGVRNAAETDQDCGGPACNACPFDKACALDRDCAGGLCNAQVCSRAKSCLELHQRHPTLVDGVYALQPASAAFDAWCDMTAGAAGGWTLLLKSNGDATFAFAATAWTDAVLLNASAPSTAPGNAKYQSYVDLPVTELRGELDGYRFTKAVAAKPAVAIFAGAEDSVEPWPMFNTGAPNWQAQPNCHRYGINLLYGTQTRFGWTANQENDCLSNDTGIGLGVAGYGAGYACGSTQCMPGNVNVSVGGNGLLWGR